MSPQDPQRPMPNRKTSEESDALQKTPIPASGSGEEIENTVVVNPQESSDESSKSSSQPVAKKKKATQLGDFRLIRKLGQGGMGEVYLANQVSLDRPVALKTLSRELAKKEDFVRRFLREARSMAKLQHPNVVQVYAADSDKGYHFVAIEFIDGQSMQDWMKTLGKLPVGDALHVVLVCAQALKHAHDQQMIHRDIKPDNILLTKNGVVKVADFGLAKAIDEDVSITQSGTGLGTPLYMAPEQARNAKHVDQRSDIYALGCTLYYFVTGQLPFTGENTLELIMEKEKGTFTPARQLQSDVPKLLDLMIDKMLSKNPEHRYGDCGELIQDLQSLELASASLSFISSSDPAVLSPFPGGSSTQHKSAVKTKVVPALGKTSAEDAAETDARKKTAVVDTRWFVQHTNSDGETVVSRLTTLQIQKGLAAATIDMKGKGKKSAEEKFLPLAQFQEFVEAVEKQAVKSQAKSRSSRMKDMYSQIDKEESKRQRRRWFRDKTDSALGFVGLLVYLAFIAGAIYGLYFLGTWAWKYIADHFGFSDQEMSGISLLRDILIS